MYKNKFFLYSSNKQLENILNIMYNKIKQHETLMGKFNKICARPLY